MKAYLYKTTIVNVVNMNARVTRYKLRIRIAFNSDDSCANPTYTHQSQTIANITQVD